jgi:cysteine-rich repeat protein
MKRKIIVAIAALAVGTLGSTAPVHAGGTPAQKCAGAKQKVVSKDEGGNFGCYSKAAGKAPFSVDPSCLAKANALTAAFTKADPTGLVCEGTDSSVQFTINHCIDQINAVLLHDPSCTPDPPGCTGKCTAAKLKAVSKDAGGKVKCWAGATGKGLPTGGPSPDPKFTACIAKADGGLAPKFTKADGSAPCPGDATAINGIIDTACIQPVVSQMPAVGVFCGNGILDPQLGETCDDGNTVDGDACPHNCIIQSCTVNSATHQSISLQLTTPPAVTVGGLTLLLDFPEGNVHFNHTTPGASVLDTPNNLTYELKDALIDSTLLDGIPANGAGAMLQVAFDGCQGQPLPTAADYAGKCIITDASDENGVAITSGLSCTVTIP